MSFRKRNVGLSRSNEASTSTSEAEATIVPQNVELASGTRPSPVDGRLTTSTGTPTFDALLAGHAGLPLGHSILLEENGTTDYAGSLLKNFAAEGIVQGHTLHVVGVREGWARLLPGQIGAADHNLEGAEARRGDTDKMKIAWRYERLGRVGEETNRASPAAAARGVSASSASDTTAPLPEYKPFCHVFDLAKRLGIPSSAVIHYVTITPSPREPPFAAVLKHLSTQLRDSSPTTIHRVAIPTILSPALYPPQASEPSHLIQFFHALRSLLRQYPTQLVIMTTIPLELYPRATGLVRWLELLSDGVLELTPFPHIFDEGPGSNSTSGAATAHEDQPQGMVKVHKLPVFHERGGGGGGLSSMGDDLAFTVSRRKFTIKPFSLPPAEGDTEAQKGNAEGAQSSQKLTKEQIDF